MSYLRTRNLRVLGNLFWIYRNKARKNIGVNSIDGLDWLFDLWRLPSKGPEICKRLKGFYREKRWEGCNKLKVDKIVVEKGRVIGVNAGDRVLRHLL